MTAVNKIDSNVVGTMYAEEESPGVLPGVGGADAVWKFIEPNSFSDFGGALTLLTRNPISSSRQRKKGAITDLDASGGFNQDLTQSNLQDLFQGLMFADLRPKAEFAPTQATASTDTFSVPADGTDVVAGDLVFVSGFGEEANNGLHTVVSSTATTIVVEDGLVDETTTGVMVHVGFEFGVGEVEIPAISGYPTLYRSSGTKDLTEFGLIPGEPLYVGGDAALTRFTEDDPLTNSNNGFMRVKSVTTTLITFDKTQYPMTVEASGSQTIQIFFGRILKNELGSLVKKRTYQIERTLGASDDSAPSEIQSEYLVKAALNECAINIAQADKITCDLTFIAGDAEQRDGATGVKIGTRETLVEADAFNTSSDFKRIRLAQVVDGDPLPTPLFAYVTDLSLNFNNNIQQNKAVGILGAMDTSAGTFEVSGEMSAYLSSISAVQAVRNNSDVTLDIHMTKQNAGISIDLPMIALGGGRVEVEQDNPIKIPLNMDAASGAKYDTNMDYTAMWTFWDYLPDAAM